MKRLACLAVTTMLLCSAASAASKSHDHDSRVLEQIEFELCRAEMAMDVDRIMRLYVPTHSLRVFDMMKPREYFGAKAFRNDWEGFIAKSVKSIDKCEVSEIEVETSGDLGATYYIQHAEFTDKTGKKGAANTRITHVFRRINGQWLIIHEHGSYPIDWTTGMGDLLSNNLSH